MTDNPSYKHWQLERDNENIAWLAIDRCDESVNTLNSDVMQELDTILSELETALPAGLVIYSPKASGFIAGADIREFEQQADREVAKAGIEMAHRVFARLEALPCYSVAAIHGFCLGGGLELALPATTGWHWIPIVPGSVSRKSSWGFSPALVAPHAVFVCWAAARHWS